MGGRDGRKRKGEGGGIGRWVRLRVEKGRHGGTWRMDWERKRLEEEWVNNCQSKGGIMGEVARARRTEVEGA